MGREWEITFEQTDEFNKVGIRRFWLRYLRRPQKIAYMSFFLAGLVWALITGKNTYVLLFGGAMLCIVLILMTQAWWHVRKVTSAWRSYPNRKVIYRFGDQGVLQETALSSSTIAWSLFHKIWKSSDVWILFLHGGHSFLTVPAQLLDGELGEFITRKIEAAGGVDYFKCPKCSYNLIGNESGTCPECGTVIPLEERGISREHFDELSAKLLREESDPK